MTRQKPEPNDLNETKKSSGEADIVEKERKKYIRNKLGWKCHTQDLRRACRHKIDGWGQTNTK